MSAHPSAPPAQHASKSAGLLQLAASHLRSGRIDDAERACREVLQSAPREFNALHFLGICASMRGRYDQAVDLLTAALDSHADAPAAWFQRGTALQGLGRHELAIADYDRAIALKPDYVEALCNRASALQALGSHEDAIAGYDAALAIQPSIAEALTNRGVALGALGRHEQAIADHDRAILLKPAYAEAHFNRAHVLQALSRQEEAIAGYGAAIAIRPDYADAYCNRGLGLHALNRQAEALADYDRALALSPAFAEAWCNRGVTLQALNRHDDALRDFARAIGIRPDYAEAHCNRAYTLKALARPAEAIEDCDRALAIRPDYSEAKYLKAHCMLTFGLSEPALKLYEHRLRSKVYKGFPDLGLPLLGERDPRGCRLLVQWEQRFGDVIQMLRYVPELERLVHGAGECWWQVSAPLRALVSRSFPGVRVIDAEERPQGAELRVPFTSLPLALRTFSDAAIPTRVPYLIADAVKSARLREEWQSASALPLVAIAWRGNPDPPNRSVRIEQLEPLFELEGIRFVALQKDITDAESAWLSQRPRAQSAGAGLHSFDDTAAALAAVDLVITIDCAVAHLAGALGRPTWVVLKHGADSRWMLERDDSPWYPTARLFRQARLTEWGDVVARLRDALAARFSR
jgi:tetratricopeptide (TPR) repeat protein